MGAYFIIYQNWLNYIVYNLEHFNRLSFSLACRKNRTDAETIATDCEAVCHPVRTAQLVDRSAEGIWALLLPPVSTCFSSSFILSLTSLGVLDLIIEDDHKRSSCQDGVINECFIA